MSPREDAVLVSAWWETVVRGILRLFKCSYPIVCQGGLPRLPTIIDRKDIWSRKTSPPVTTAAQGLLADYKGSRDSDTTPSLTATVRWRGYDITCAGKYPDAGWQFQYVTPSTAVPGCLTDDCCGSRYGLPKR